MNQKIIKNGTNVVVVTKYKDITPELMLMILKSGINELNLFRNCFSRSQNNYINSTYC